MSLQSRLATLISAIGADVKSLQSPGVWTVVTKGNDESVNSSNTGTTTQNDDELFFATVAGAIYEIEMTIIYVSPVGGATPDFKFNLGEASDGVARGVLTAAGLSSSDAAQNFVVTAHLTASPAIFGTATTSREVKVNGIYWANGGTFILKWAQNTSNANNVTVKAGSILRYRRIL